MRNTRTASLLALVTTATIGLAACSSPSTDTGTSTSTSTPSSVERIEMPVGSIPEGIAIDGSTAYVTSFADGSVYSVDLTTGDYDVLSPATGTGSVGIMLDEQGRLFVAGGVAGTIRVLDAASGSELASYTVPTPADAVMVNDFTVLDGAVYATDSRTPVLYRLSLGEAGQLPGPTALEVINLTGVTFTEGFNNNGIATTPDGDALVVVQTNSGTLFRIDEATGEATPISLTGIENVSKGDGMLREGNTLYVVRNLENEVAVLELDDAGTTAELVDTITSADFDSPTTMARFEDRFYLPNARFTLTDFSGEDFSVVSVPSAG